MFHTTTKGKRKRKKMGKRRRMCGKIHIQLRERMGEKGVRWEIVLECEEVMWSRWKRQINIDEETIM